MHMLSKKVLSSDELDTLRGSRTLTVVLTPDGEVRTHEEVQVFVHNLILFVTVQLPAVLSLGKLCEDHGYSNEWVSGQKPRLTKEGKTIMCKTGHFVPLVVPGFSTSSGSNSSSTSTMQDLSSTSPAQERSDGLASGDWCGSPRKPKQKQKEMTGKMKTTVCKIFLSGWRSSQIIWRTLNWMHPHAVLRTQIRNVLRKWDQNQGSTVFLLTFLKDRNCEVCLRTKMTRAPCRGRTGEALLRAEKIGDLMTADHKVFNEGCASRDNHRYAVVVQDLATQWIQSYPCKTKTSQETQRSLQKFLEPDRKPKVIYTDNSLAFGKACEDLSWNHCTSTPHRSETNGIAERAVRRVKEGTSAVLLQSGLDENWWADSMECLTYL